jgi:hypothetical protein
MADIGRPVRNVNLALRQASSGTAGDHTTGEARAHPDCRSWPSSKRCYARVLSVRSSEEMQSNNGLGNIQQECQPLHRGVYHQRSAPSPGTWCPKGLRSPCHFGRWCGASRMNASRMSGSELKKPGGSWSTAGVSGSGLRCFWRRNSIPCGEHQWEPSRHLACPGRRTPHSVPRGSGTHLRWSPGQQPSGGAV